MQNFTEGGFFEDPAHWILGWDEFVVGQPQEFDFGPWLDLGGEGGEGS